MGLLKAIKQLRVKRKQELIRNRLTDFDLKNQRDLGFHRDENGKMVHISLHYSDFGRFKWVSFITPEIFGTRIDRYRP